MEYLDGRQDGRGDEIASSCQEQELVARQTRDARNPGSAAKVL